MHSLGASTVQYLFVEHGDAGDLAKTVYSKPEEQAQFLEKLYLSFRQGMPDPHAEATE